jgi:hypothetical protein
VVDHFHKLPDTKYEEMFGEGLTELKQLKDDLERQLQACSQQRDRFKELYYHMKQSREEMM